MFGGSIEFMKFLQIAKVSVIECKIFLWKPHCKLIVVFVFFVLPYKVEWKGLFNFGEISSLYYSRVQLHSEIKLKFSIQRDINSDLGYKKPQF